MSLFAVTREAGPAWAAGGIFEQPEVNDHAAFMNQLAEQGFVLFGGPLADSEQGQVRVLLIVDAESVDEIHRRLADDPWVSTQQLQTVNVESWKLLVGGDSFLLARAGH